MNILALKPLSRGKTSNVQHRTSNAEVSEDSRCHSMFGVGCSMFLWFIERAGVRGKGTLAVRAAFAGDWTPEDGHKGREALSCSSF